MGTGLRRSLASVTDGNSPSTRTIAGLPADQNENLGPVFPTDGMAIPRIKHSASHSSSVVLLCHPWGFRSRMTGDLRSGAIRDRAGDTPVAILVAGGVVHPIWRDTDLGFTWRTRPTA